MQAMAGAPGSHPRGVPQEVTAVGSPAATFVPSAKQAKHEEPLVRLQQALKQINVRAIQHQELTKKGYLNGARHVTSTSRER